MEQSKKRVLFVTRSYLFQNNGGSNASKAYVNAFSQIYNNLTLLYPEKKEGMSDQHIPQTVKRIPCYDKRSNIIKGLDMYRGRLLRFYKPVKRILAKEIFDIVVFDNSITSLGLIKYAKRNGAKVVIIHHNVETDYLKDNPVSILYALPYRHYVVKAEREALESSSLNLTLTNTDAMTFAKMRPEKNLHLHTIGVFEYFNRENCGNMVCQESFKIKNKVFVISGSLYFKQSEKPIITFLTNYYPLLKEKYPEAKLIVTGRNPSERLSHIISIMNGVELIPNPDDINDVIKKADYYLCPIDAGSGLKLRIMDGLKNGLPVISHTIATRGYEELIKKKVIYKYNDSQSFISSLREIIESHYSPSEIYNAYIQYFGLKAGVNRVKNALKAEGFI